MRIGILTAMDKEKAAISSMLDDRHETLAEGIQYTLGRRGRHSIALAAMGIGKVNAALGAEAIIRLFKPDAVISAGVAGGLESSKKAGIRIMDVVAGNRYSYHDVWCGSPNGKGQVQGMPQYFPADAKLVRAAEMLAMMRNASGGQKVHCGLIVSGDQFIEDNAAKEAICVNFPDSLAADMESAALAHVCYMKNVPFISFRIISDIPGSENHSGQYEDFWAELAEKSFAITKAFIAALP